MLCPAWSYARSLRRPAASLFRPGNPCSCTGVADWIVFLGLVRELVSPVMQSHSMVARITVIGLVQPEVGLADDSGAISSVPDVAHVPRFVRIGLGSITPCAVFIDTEA